MLRLFLLVLGMLIVGCREEEPPPPPVVVPDFGEVRAQVVAPVVAADSAALLAPLAPEEFWDGAEGSAQLERLRALLLLSEPRGDDEPGLDAGERVWLAAYLSRSAADVSPGTVHEFVEEAARNPELLFDRAALQATIDDGRKKIRRNRDAIFLHRIARDVDVEDHDMVRLSGSYVGLKNPDSPVPGRFTKAAWEGGVRDAVNRLPHDVGRVAWVFGPTLEDPRKLAESVRAAFFDAYIRAWIRLLMGSYVDAASDITEARSLVRDLTARPVPPLERLCRAVRYNTTPEPVRARFEQFDAVCEAAVDVLQPELNKLRTALEAYDPADDYSRMSLRATAHSGRKTVEAFVSTGELGEWRVTLHKWLAAPFYERQGPCFRTRTR